MVEVRNITKRYGPFVAVDNVEFSVDKGQVLGFIGPNGAGKTTTMRILTGFLPTSAGTAVVAASRPACSRKSSQRASHHTWSRASSCGNGTPSSIPILVRTKPGMLHNWKLPMAMCCAKNTRDSVTRLCLLP